MISINMFSIFEMSVNSRVRKLIHSTHLYEKCCHHQCYLSMLTDSLSDGWSSHPMMATGCCILQAPSDREIIVLRIFAAANPCHMRS